MPAALRLRLTEGWRRGGLPLLFVGSGIVFAVAWCETLKVLFDKNSQQGAIVENLFSLD